MEKLKVIKNLNQLSELLEYIKNNEFISFDTETTGIEIDSQIIGMSFSADTDLGYYVVLSYWDVPQQKLLNTEVHNQAKILVQKLQNKKLIMHNGIFDCSMVNRNYNIDLMPYLHTDTMILAHLLDENRHNGLKELGVSFFGQDAKAEQLAMKESVHKNGGTLTKDKYELYKADADLIAKYGAKDAILTIKLFYILVEQLYENNLDKFFYEEESMPLLRGPTYELNTIGLKIDTNALQGLRTELEAYSLECKAFIDREINKLVSDKYPGTKKTNTFNIGSSKQLAWLLFIKLGQSFEKLTEEGREVCKALSLRLPYTYKAKLEFLSVIASHKNRIYEPAKFNAKTGKLGRPKKVKEVWNYLAADKTTLKTFASKYKWAEKLLEYSKTQKILNTYVIGIQERMKYGIIRPSFLQHGTTSGRYSSRNPNFTNLPRDDKRIKNCIIARDGKVFVGADYSQLEPRVFASLSGDINLQKAFVSGDDFYSTIGIAVFDKYDATPKKDGDSNAFGIKYKNLRNIAKIIALSATYGTTANKMASAINKSVEEAQVVIDDYFSQFPKVKQFMDSCHSKAVESGYVLSLYGRPRRMPDAKRIPVKYGKLKHGELPYEARNLLNLSVNHTIQSTAASITNRAMIEFKKKIISANIKDCKLVLMVHDEIVAECREEDAGAVMKILKDAMENASKIPGVCLEAEPKIAKNMGNLK